MGLWWAGMYSESKVDYDYFSSRITLRPEKYLNHYKGLKFRCVSNVLWGQTWEVKTFVKSTTFILKGHTTEGCYHQVRCTWHPLIGEACRLYRILWLKERWLCMYGFMLKVSKNTILHEQSVGQYLWPIVRGLRYRINFYFCNWGKYFQGQWCFGMYYLNLQLMCNSTSSRITLRPWKTSTLS